MGNKRRRNNSTVNKLSLCTPGQISTAFYYVSSSKPKSAPERGATTPTPHTVNNCHCPDNSAPSAIFSETTHSDTPWGHRAPRFRWTHRRRTESHHQFKCSTRRPDCSYPIQHHPYSHAQGRNSLTLYHHQTQYILSILWRAWKIHTAVIHSLLSHPKASFLEKC